jgi:hypothetical protein
VVFVWPGRLPASLPLEIFGVIGIAKTLTSDRSAQVFLLYHRQNYDRGPDALGLGRGTLYFAAEVDRIHHGVN